MQQNIVRRNRAAQAGHRLRLVLVRATHDCVNLKTRRGLNNALHPVQVADTGQFHQNLVVAQAVLLNQRLAHAERVHAVANRLDRLLDRLGLES